MEYFEDEFDFHHQQSGEGLLPYREEDWELAAEPQQSLPCLEPDDAPNEHLDPYSQQQLASFYHNPLLEKGDDFANQFLESAAEFHPQFQLLLRSLQQSIKHLETLRQKCEECDIHVQNLCQKVFDTSIGEAKAEAYCQDQRKVYGTHTFQTCKFNEGVAAKLRNAILDSQRVGLDETSLAVYSLTLAQLQCDQLIYEVASTASRHSENLSKNTGSLSTSVLVKLVEESIDDVRRCLNTAFHFMRKEETPEGQFALFLQKWISQLVSLLYDMTRDGGLQNAVDEEMFVLNHLIRSQPGTQKWANNLVQISSPKPSTDLWESRIYLDNVIYMLFLILRAPKGRDEFLSTLKSSNSVAMLKQEDADADWTLLDHSNDDMRGVGSKWHVLPHESDLVSLYRQIPFEAVLSRIFSLTKAEQSYRCSSDHISSDRFLQTIACCDIMCEVLGEGLATLGVSKYKQLVRRIAQTLRNIVLLMSEHWSLFKKNVETQPKRHTFARMQMEYDEFVKRCVERFLTVAKLGVYQFLADLPFESVSQKAAETLYLLLNVPAGSRAEVDQLSKTAYTRQDWLDFVEDPDTKLAFEDQLSGMPENEVVYLLTTFCNLAQARPTSESHLVNIVIMDVFRVSFVYASTRDICSKMGRELLCAVASLHPYIISTILQYLGERMNEITSTIFYVISDLPFYKWVPTRQDFSLLKSWIMENPITSIPTRLVQIILKGMNWGFGEDGALFLPYNLHYEVAVMLIEICYQYEVEKQQSGLILKSIDQVSKVASAMRSSLTLDESFIVWTWDILLRLKLHRSQIGDVSQERYKVAQVVDINEDPFLPKYNKHGIPQGFYVTIMATNAGHSMNMFLQSGLGLLKKLSEKGHRVPAVQCLSCVTPMFMQTEIDLSINANFVSILSDLMAPTEAGILSGITSKLIEQQATAPLHLTLLMGSIGADVEIEDPVLVITYWLKVALAIPAWWENGNSRALVDFLLKAAFYRGHQCYDECRAILYERHVDLMLNTPKNNPSPTHQNHSVISSILSFVSGGNASGAPSFLRDITSVHTYLAYFVLDAETRYEDDSRLWTTLLNLMKSNGPDSHIKKASSQVKLTHTPLGSQLVIYRWGLLLTKTPTTHPLLPAICQKFFLRYIYIAPELGCSLGPKFFAPAMPANLFKKVKSKLAEVGDTEIQTSDADLAMRIKKIFDTFSVWIDEEKLHDDNLYLPSLPSRYDPRLLATIRTKDSTLWSEFINFVTINQELETVSIQWANFHKVEIKPFPTHSSSMAIHVTSCQRVNHLLHQFESPLTLPPLANEISSLVAISDLNSLTTHQQITDEIDPDLKAISLNAQTFSDAKKKLDIMNVSYVEQLPDLYFMEEKRMLMSIECQSAFSSSHRCTGPARVELRFMGKTLNEGVSEKLKTNRETTRELISTMTSMHSAEELSYTALHMINVVHMLGKAATSPVHSEKAEIFDVGAKLFYTLADMNSDERWNCPSTHHLLTTCLDFLGQVFICGRSNQAVPLLEQMLKRPEMAALLSAHFSPAKSCEIKIQDGGVIRYDTATFVEMYEKVLGAVTEGAGDQSSDVIFVLITKFDVEEWASKFSPPSVDILRLLRAVISGLTLHGTQVSTPSTPDQERMLLRSPSAHSHLSSSAVQEIFTSHLCIIVQNAASVVFFEAVNSLLKASEGGKIDTSVWDALVSTAFSRSPPNSCHYVPAEAACPPGYDCINKCIKHIALYFYDKRKSGSGNLYSKWGPYVQSLSGLMYELCLSEVESYGSTDGAVDHFNDIVMPLFSAWLEPFYGENSEKLIWPWLEVVVEQKQANHMLSAFSSVLDVLCHADTTDLSSLVANCWRFYVKNVVVAYGVLAPSYICSSYQTALSSLPWERFVPNITDQDLMVQLCDTKLGCSVHFLCHIIPEIDWSRIVSMCSVETAEDGTRLWVDHTPEVLCRFLHVLFILCAEKERITSYPKLQNLLGTIDDFPWSLISYQQLDYLANLVSDHYDATSLSSQSQDKKLSHDPRFAAIRIFQLISGFGVLASCNGTQEVTDKLQNDPEIDEELVWMKRKSYIICVGRIIRSLSKQDPKKLDTLARLVSIVTHDTLGALMVSVTPAVSESTLDMVHSEIWRWLNAFPAKLQDALLAQIFTFLDREVVAQGESLKNGKKQNAAFNSALCSLVSSGYDTITDPTHLANVLERCFDFCIQLVGTEAPNSYSKDCNDTQNTSSDVPSSDVGSNVNGENAEKVIGDLASSQLWHSLCAILERPPKVKKHDLTDTCIAKDCILTLVAIACSDCSMQNGEEKISRVNGTCLCLAQWMSSVSPKAENEPKIMLLLGCFLQACEFLRRVAESKPDSDVNLNSVADILEGILPLLEQWSMDRVKTGLLGNIGIARASSLSLQFRTAVRCVSVYIQHVVDVMQHGCKDGETKGQKALEALQNLPSENRAYAPEGDNITDFCSSISKCYKKEVCAESREVVKAIICSFFPKQSHYFFVLLWNNLCSVE